MNTQFKALFLLVCGMFYWQFVCWLTRTAEPWDTDTYWRLWYPVSFILSALVGILFKARGWMAGAILTFAQLPIIWLNTRTGDLWPVGVISSSILAIPAMAISAFTGWYAVRPRPV